MNVKMYDTIVDFLFKTCHMPISSKERNHEYFDLMVQVIGIMGNPSMSDTVEYREAVDHVNNLPLIKAFVEGKHGH